MLDELASRYLDGESSEAEERELLDLLKRDPAARAEFARWVNQHAALRWQFSAPWWPSFRLWPNTESTSRKVFSVSAWRCVCRAQQRSTNKHWTKRRTSSSSSPPSFLDCPAIVINWRTSTTGE